MQVRVGNVTVKIYRLKRGKYTSFQVSDYSTGKRVLRWFNALDEAKREADNIARLIANGETTAASLSNGSAASYGRAMELIKETGLTLEIACAHLSQAVKRLGGVDRLGEAVDYFIKHDPSQLEMRTVQEAVTELLEHKQSMGKSERYLKQLENRLGKFADAFQMPIGSVTQADVQGFMDRQQGGARTKLEWRKLLNVLFKFAAARNYCTSNPVADTEEIRIKNTGKVEIYTPAELTLLLKCASKDFLPCLVLGAFAGLRSAEIQRLTWKNIDLAKGFVTVDAGQAKTASRRLIPIQPCLAGWLAPYAKRSGLIWKGTEVEFYEAQAATAQGAGLKWKANGLRHSFCSYRLAQVQNAAQVSLEAGNSPQIVFRHYRELVTPADANAWFAVTPKSPANVVSLKEVAHA